MVITGLLARNSVGLSQNSFKMFNDNYLNTITLAKAALTFSYFILKIFE